MFLLWAYDLEFFTIKHASEDMGRSAAPLAQKTIYPLMKEGYVYKHFDRLTPIRYKRGPPVQRGDQAQLQGEICHHSEG